MIVHRPPNATFNRPKAWFPSNATYATRTRKYAINAMNATNAADVDDATAGQIVILNSLRLLLQYKCAQQNEF